MALVMGLVALQVLLVFALGWPGHMSVDSLVQLYEGRTHKFISFNPPIMSLLLGAFDDMGSGPVGFLVLSTAMLSTATWLALTRGPIKKGFAALALLMVLNPVLLLHAGIVWKDVLLGHAVVLVWMCIDQMPHWRRSTQWLVLPLLALLLALMASVRQQGWLFALPLAAWCAWRVTGLSKPGRCLVLLFLLGTAWAVQQGAAKFAHAHGADALPAGHEVGLRILMRFDLTGMIANGSPASALMTDAMRNELETIVPLYSPARVDTLVGPSVQHWTTPMPLLWRIWSDQIRQDPAIYVKHRLAVWGHALGWYGVQSCLPYFRGVAGPVLHDLVNGSLNDHLGLPPAQAALPKWIEKTVWALTASPLWWHGCYLLMSIAMGVWAWRKRDGLSLTVLACSALFMGSYAVLGIACDFRYGYTLTGVVSLMGLRLLQTRTSEAQPS